MNSQPVPTQAITEDWVSFVVCPRDKKPLTIEGDFLFCPKSGTCIMNVNKARTGA
jgi:hypothetical protein